MMLRTLVPACSLALALSACASSTLGGLPDASYRSLRDDASLAQRAGDAEFFLGLPRFSELEEQISKTDQVVKLRMAAWLKPGNLGLLPAGSRLGFNGRGELEWVVLSEATSVRGRELPKGTVITLRVDSQEGQEVMDRIILGGTTHYGRNKFRAGDEITEWREGHAFPSVVTLNDQHTFFGKRYADAAQITFTRAGEVAGVINADQLSSQD